MVSKHSAAVCPQAKPADMLSSLVIVLTVKTIAFNNMFGHVDMWTCGQHCCIYHCIDVCDGVLGLSREPEAMGNYRSEHTAVPTSQLLSSLATVLFALAIITMACK